MHAEIEPLPKLLQSHSLLLQSPASACDSFIGRFWEISCVSLVVFWQTACACSPCWHGTIFIRQQAPSVLQSRGWSAHRQSRKSTIALSFGIDCLWLQGYLNGTNPKDYSMSAYLLWGTDVSDKHFTPAFGLFQGSFVLPEPASTVPVSLAPFMTNAFPRAGTSFISRTRLCGKLFSHHSCVFNCFQLKM